MALIAWTQIRSIEFIDSPYKKSVNESHTILVQASFKWIISLLEFDNELINEVSIRA